MVFPNFTCHFLLPHKIIIACVTVLPLALFAIIGINGESLTSFVINFFLYLKHRRIVGICPEAAEEESASEKQTDTVSGEKAKKNPKQKKKASEDFPDEFGSYKERKAAKRKEKGHPDRSGNRQEQTIPLLNPAAEYLRFKIENGIIYTRDHRFVKIVEIVPINFLLLQCQRTEKYYLFVVSYLKISPVKLQFKVLTRRADINRHLEAIKGRWHRKQMNAVWLF